MTNPTDKSDPVFVEVVEALKDEELGHLKNAIMIAERTSLATVYVPIVTAKKIIELSSIAGRLEAAEKALAKIGRLSADAENPLARAVNQIASAALSPKEKKT
jgi:hypothetical protein